MIFGDLLHGTGFDAVQTVGIEKQARHVHPDADQGGIHFPRSDDEFAEPFGIDEASRFGAWFHRGPGLGCRRIVSGIEEAHDGVA